MSEASTIPTKNTAWIANLSAQTLPFLTFLVVTPLIVAGLGGNGYGRLIIFSLFPQILTQFDLGIATSAVRLMSQAMSHGSRIDAKRTLLRILGASLAAGALLTAAFYFARSLIASAIGILDQADAETTSIDGEFAYVALTVLVGFASIPFSACLRSAGRLRFVAVTQSISGIVFWLGAALIAQGNGPLTMILATGALLAALSGAVQSVAAWRVVARMALRLPDYGKVEPQPRRHGEYFDLAAFAAQLTSLVTYHADKMLISAFVSPAAAGAYSICANVAGKLLVLAAAISAYSFPHAARLHSAKATPLLRQLQDTGTTTVVTVSAFLAAPAIALSENFLRAWLGVQFAADYAIVLQLLLAGYLFATFSTVSSNVAYAIGRSDICAKFAALGGILTLSTCFILVRPYGTNGAACAALVGMSQAVWFSRVVANEIGQPMEHYWRFHVRLIAIGAAIAIPLTLFSPWINGWFPLLTMGAFGVVAGGWLWAALGFASPEHVQALQRIRQKFRQILRKGP